MFQLSWGGGGRKVFIETAWYYIYYKIVIKVPVLMASNLYRIPLVLSHMFGFVVEQKLLGRSQTSLVFLKSSFFGSEKSQVTAHVLQK
jgi:hypothetical protein